MPRNGSGQYDLPYNWNDDRTNGIRVLASRMQAQDQDLADAITASVAKNGETPLTGNLNLNSNRLINIADGTNAQDAAAVSQVQSGELQYYGVSATPTLGTDGEDYQITPSPNIATYPAYLEFSFVAHFTCITSPQLQLDSLAQKAMVKDDGAGGYSALVAGDIVADAQYKAIYNEDISTSNIIIKEVEKENQGFNNLNIVGKFSLSPAQALTIASGAVTAANSSITLDTESSSASDDLDTISGGVDGMKLKIQIANSARNVILKHNTGNIFNPSGFDIVLDTTSDKVWLDYDSSLSKWIVSSSFSLCPVLNIQDRKSSGTTGGTSSAGFNTRVLNTIVKNTISGASLATNVITLPAGSYEVSATAPAYAAGPHQLFLYNSSDSTTVLYGSSQNMGGGGNANSTPSIVSGVFTISESKNFILRHYIRDGVADGLGAAVSTSLDEVYAQILIKKIG